MGNQPWPQFQNGIRERSNLQPIPDPKNPMHYPDVFSTPLVDGKGKNRETDNWQPRVQISKAFNEGLISLKNK